MREQRLAQVTIHQSIHPGVLCHRHHEAELRHSREECWGRQQELAAVKEKLSNSKTTLEDRRKDTVSYKVMPCGSECLPLLPPCPSAPPPPLHPPPPPCTLPKHSFAADLKLCQRKLQDNDLKPQFLHLLCLINVKISQMIMQRDKQTISLQCKSADLAMIKPSINALRRNLYRITMLKL